MVANCLAELEKFFFQFILAGFLLSALNPFWDLKVGFFAPYSFHFRQSLVQCVINVSPNFVQSLQSFLPLPPLSLNLTFLAFAPPPPPLF